MSPESPTVKRQARGQARIEQILAAAAIEFGERGYESTTTNAIAARAGISPGSLYQFFSDKEDVARALAERYAQQLAERQIDVEALATMAVPLAVRAVIRPLVELNLAQPGFKALLTRPDMPDAVRDAVAPMSQLIHAQVSSLAERLLPALGPEALARTVTILIHTVRGTMPAIVMTREEEREALITELERSLTAYLEALAGS
ncbi:TetR/AcrR family transcriptional regulator [Agromyces albus]|uniref:TetR/AcrR family transcriptional regulator n=1 Tax=Agromyces albus TaxID=205332 RepID=UPI002781080D|nr:TetR/AcrR family transcriptional regulator [Agromyces albus]MDQ0574052.1 AcrR family transcriptional regulator [Agromyces albus]